MNTSAVFRPKYEWALELRSIWTLQGNIMGTTMNIMVWVRRRNRNLLGTTTTNIMGWVRRRRRAILWSGYDNEYYGLGTTTNIMVRRRNSNYWETMATQIMGQVRRREILWDGYDDDADYGMGTTTRNIMGRIRRRRRWIFCNELGTTTTTSIAVNWVRQRQ